MTLTRRHFAISLGAVGLAACSGPVPTPARAQTASLPADLLPTPNAGYDAWVSAFKQRAARQGITPQTLATAFRTAGYLPGVITRDTSQIERRRTLEEYLSIAASDDRVTKGRAAFARHRSTLSALEARYGVDAKIIAAIWGLESTFGERRGNIPVISATSTLAYTGRRGAFYEKQLIAALKILQNGDVSPGNFTGSWAGAMGHTQFIPTSYLAFAVDNNGDGRRDVWSDDPGDALASTAAYLARNGWVKGLPWGAEQGPGAPKGNVIQPQTGGPKFVVTRNFRVIKSYNNSVPYALGVGHLADRIAGGGPLRGSFPPDAYGMTKQDRQNLQRGLTAKGFDTGGTDGVIGPQSRAAIRAFQTSRGMAPTGEPSLTLLRLVQ